MNKVQYMAIAMIILTYGSLFAQSTSNHGNKFESLGTMLPTANEYRTASGAPGVKYWQQRADYNIKCELDESKRLLTGSETITYFNNSPDILTYLWLQLDENQKAPHSMSNFFNESTMPLAMTERDLDRMRSPEEALKDYGVNIRKVTDVAGKPLKYSINQTMMRVELPSKLLPQQKYVFNIDWSFHLVDRLKYGNRGGFEHFPEDGNDLYTVTQWYPRMCVYSDVHGWQNKQFTGPAEFTLPFGNFTVQMTVPADHVVGSTGSCQNYAQVLPPAQLARWNKAQTAKEPVEIATLEEAKNRETTKSTAKKTWVFKAENVRDFAWTSSRKFIWDAMPYLQADGKKIMCMSFYPKESYCLYRPYSTKVVAHTLKTYSKFTIPYPYPVAQSIEAANGMEYPMIAFNFGRCEKDGTYEERTKYGMIGVIIHEVGHNYFPMIINSDERQWTWMDEGLNTFVQFLAESEFDNNYPSSRGLAAGIADYMKLPKDRLEPIMTDGENIIALGPNAYAKPAAALNILRETIMGRELFDYAFKEYARRWAFKHPTPADFFRTMEDASGVNLDWFWRGWFYSIDAVDLAIDSVLTFAPEWESAPPRRENTFTERKTKPVPDLSKLRNKQDTTIKFAVDVDTTLRDFYYYYQPWETEDSVSQISRINEGEVIPKDSQELLLENKHFYELHFSNKGGLVMPIILEWTYADGTTEIERIPAEIWRKNENKVKKLFIKKQPVVNVKLDPWKETADIDDTNNAWKITNEEPSRFKLYRQKNQPKELNPMQREQQKLIKP